MKLRLSQPVKLQIEWIMTPYGLWIIPTFHNGKMLVVNDAWIMLTAIGALTQNVEVGTCVTDAIRRHPSAIALSTITLDRVTKGRGMLGIGIVGKHRMLLILELNLTKPVAKFKKQ